MPARPLRRMTEAEYLAWEADQEDKHELVNGEIVAMSGASPEHSTIQANLIAALVLRLRGRPCRAHGSDLRVRIDETGLYAYPDLTVVCGPPSFSETNPPSLLNPTLIVEVTSTSTSDYDIGAKAAHYRRRGSVSTILFVDSTTRSVQIQQRNADGTWTLIDQRGGDVILAQLQLTIPMEEIYDGVGLG